MATALKFGAGNFPVRPLRDELRRVADMGFDYFEICMDPPEAHWSVIRDQADALVRDLDRYGMGVVCHLPGFVYIADLSPAIRAASVSEMIRCLDTATAIGAQKVVLHPGVMNGLGVFVPEQVHRYGYESLCTLMDHAAGLGLEVCFENMFPDYQVFFSPDAFAEVFASCPSLKMTLDIGHAHIGDVQGTRACEFVRRFFDRIAHIHVSDNSGKTDDHLPVGQGTIDFVPVVRLLRQKGYDGSVTCEVFFGTREDMIRSREYVAALFASV